MEGSSQRQFHRTEQDCPVAVRNGDRLDRIARGVGNLSVGGDRGKNTEAQSYQNIPQRQIRCVGDLPAFHR